MDGSPLRQRRRLLWGGLLASTVFLFTLAFAPPLLSPAWRTVIMDVFSSVCHQLPARSPHVDGIQVAICDRCVGIYLGLVLGVATVHMGTSVWKTVTGYGGYVLFASLIPAGIDWLGPVLGLWSNVPLSRAGTGLIFGLVAASFVAHRLISKAARPPQPARSP